VILVLWALFLPVLAGLVVGVIALGNLLQSADNTQNAADAAALAAAGALVTAQNPPPMVVNSIPIPWSDECQVGPKDTITTCTGTTSDETQCSHYNWLCGYAIYEVDTWLLIWTDPDATKAISYAGSAWTCTRVSTGPGHHHHHGQPYCVELNIYPPGPTSGSNSSLSDDNTVTVATMATREAMFVEANYGFTSYSACTPPPDFFLALGPTSTCIGYDADGTIWVSVPDPGIFPGSGFGAAVKSAWATWAGGTAVLCSEPPPTASCP
jgi:hypothetical protein